MVRERESERERARESAGERVRLSGARYENRQKARAKVRVCRCSRCLGRGVFSRHLFCLNDVRGPKRPNKSEENTSRLFALPTATDSIEATREIGRRRRLCTV
jgi:hypothetical protein